MNIKEMIDRIVRDGYLTDWEYKDLLAAVKENGKIDPEEDEQLKRILDMITNKKLKVL